MVTLINLPSASLRRVRMQRRLQEQQLPFHALGVDMRGLGYAELGDQLRERFPNLDFDLDRLSTAEVGCWVSHLTAWQRLLASEGTSAGTVIEDDVVLAPSFRDTVRDLERDLGPFDLVYLGTSSRNVSTRRRTSLAGHAAHRPVGVILNTWGYVISRRWVATFMAQARVSIELPIDHWLGGRGPHWRPSVAVICPHVVLEDAELSQRSQIGPYTHRIDRLRGLESARRRMLNSKLGELYYSFVYRWL